MPINCFNEKIDQIMEKGSKLTWWNTITTMVLSILEITVFLIGGQVIPFGSRPI